MKTRWFHREKHLAEGVAAILGEVSVSLCDITKGNIPVECVFWHLLFEKQQNEQRK